MDGSHDDQNFRCKIKKIWSQTYVFCCQKYPIHTSIVILFFLLYLFFPLLFKILFYTSPLVGLSLFVHRVLSDINHQKIKQAEEEARRKKFAKSRRSFKSIYSDRGNLVQRNTLKKSDNVDTNVGDNDDVFLKSLHELLSEKKPDVGNFESIVGKGEGSSSDGNVNSNSNSNSNTEKDDFKGESWDASENDDMRKDHKIVRWTDDDQKNDLDLGLSEAGRNKRLESLMVRRRSRKNLGFEEKGSTENDNNVQISKVKTKKINPFLEDKSSGNKSPGSAPSSLLKTSNPFDLPYDPHEEKLDLTGDNFHEEFKVSDRPKEPVFCRHQSFSLGALSRSAIMHGKHDIPYYKDLSNKKKSIIGSDTSTLGRYISHYLFLYAVSWSISC
ncbi:uncharacterized protein LOC143612471 [Bidens hawaiensis]|uniref:uncharacterized protein LOC143612471 n=1 Tax=Bidens hawaiensis TaxID=980011 RepID=UPI0040494AB9